MNKFKYIVAMLLACSTLVAQQPQSHVAPLIAVNAKYVNGVAPGYQVLAGSGLNLSLGPGTSFCSGVINQFAGATITMTANATNNVYLNTAASCAPAVKTSGFTISDIPIAQVVTNGSTITTITDVRTFFVPPGTGGSAPVTSVFGRIGAVAAAANDYAFSQINGNLGTNQGPTALTGILKDSAGTLSAAVPGTDYALPNANTLGSAGSLGAVSALPNGTTATTQSSSDNTAKVATDQFVITAVALGTGHPSVGAPGAVQMAGSSSDFADTGCTGPTSGTLQCQTYKSTGPGGGVAGGYDYSEGTSGSGNLGHDIVQANSSTHALEGSYNGDAFSRIIRKSDVTQACIPGSFVAQTDASTVTWAINSAICANASLTFTVHGGSRVLNVTGVVDGGSYILQIQQDSTGGEGLTLGSGCTWKVSGGGGGAIVPSTGANAVDVLTFIVKGSTCYVNFNTNYN